MAYPGYPGYGAPAPGGFASPMMNPMGSQQIVGAGGWGHYQNPAMMMGMASPMMGMASPMMGAAPGMMGNPMMQGPQPWYAQYYSRMPPNEIQQLQQWFMSMDRDRSGSIAVHELAQATFFGQPLGIPAARKFIQAFDKDRSGQIDFTEYAAMHGFIMQMSQIFFQNDRDRSGTLDWTEIHGALGQSGFTLPAPVVQSCVAKFDKTGGRGVAYMDYLLVCAHLAFARSVFEWNDPQRVGKISLSFEQLAHVSIEFM